MPSAPIREAEFRKTLGELHAIDVVAAGADAAEKDRLHRAECVEHGLKLGGLTADLGRQRRAHAFIVRRAALQIGDPAQDGFLAAGLRGLVAEAIRHISNSPRKFLFDNFGPGRRDPPRQSGAKRRLLKQHLLHLGLVVAQENHEMAVGGRKRRRRHWTGPRISAVRVSPTNSRLPSRVTDSTRLGSQFVPADIGVERLRIDRGIPPRQFGDAGGTGGPAVLRQRQLGWLSRIARWRR